MRWGGSFSYRLEGAEVLCKQKPRRGKFLDKIESVNVMSPGNHLNDSKPPQCNCHCLSERWPGGSVPNIPKGGVGDMLSLSMVHTDTQAS